MASTNPQPTDRRLCRGAPTTLRANRAAAEALPAPDKEWYRAEMPDVLAERLTTFRRNCIVTVVRVEATTNRTRSNVYRTVPAAYEYVQSLDDPGTPCSHTGIRCLDADAGIYTCCRDDCETRFGRERAREVVSR
jgi:hypothetical protein